MSTGETARVPEESTGQPRRVVVGDLRLSTTFRALRHRNFRLFFVGQLISLIGTWMEQTALGWFVYQLTDSKALLGLVSAAGTAPMLFFSIWAGSLADRHSKRKILVITQTASMVVAFVLALVAWRGNVQTWQIVALSLASGVAIAFDMPARQAFTIEMTSREDLMNAISLNSSVVNGARIVGPALAGVIMARTGPALCFLINALSFVAVIACLLLMRLPARAPAKAADGAHGGVTSGLSYVFRHPRLRTILILFGVVGVFGWSYSILMPAFARDVLGLAEAGYGALLTASSAGALAGGLAVATLGHRFAPRRIALSGLWIFSLALLAFSQSRHVASCAAWLVLVGFGMMLFFATTNTTLQVLSSDEMRGRVMGVWSLVFGAMIPLGSLEAGALASGLGVSTTIAIGAVVCALAGFVALAVVRRREAALRAAASPAHAAGTPRE